MVLRGFMVIQGLSKRPERDDLSHFFSRCQGFFLVDLAAAAWSPYEIEKSYPLFFKDQMLYMGQLPEGFAVETNDGMRQGRQLESAWVENSHVEEETCWMF